jgi:hypothetical protein
MPKLIGTGEILDLYGITRGQVFRLIAAGDWPEPAAETGGGRVWDAEAVEATVGRLREAGRIAEWGGLVPWRYLDTAQPASV